MQFAEMLLPLGPTKGKDTATALGPMLVTADELEPWRTETAFDLAMTVHINGRGVGADRWSSMAFSYADMIATHPAAPRCARATSSARAPAAAAASPNSGAAAASTPTCRCRVYAGSRCRHRCMHRAAGRGRDLGSDSLAPQCCGPA
jgi:hypothetical protein